MVNLSNKSVVFLESPKVYPIPGVHLKVESKVLDDELNEGELLTRNLYISLDPYLKSKMGGVGFPSSYKVGQALDSYVVSEVVASKNAKFPVGAVVFGNLWIEEYSRVPAANNLKIIEDARESKIPLSSYVGALNLAGQTAYCSLIDIGKPKAGETIYISAACGGVGQLVGQISKLLGLRVIGSAGSDEKVDYLIKTLKFDAAFNYKKGNIVDSLRAAAPEGINIYYDNVGGETLEAALEVLNRFGRVVLCGMSGIYNRTTPYGIKNIVLAILKSLKLEGFVANQFSEELEERFFKDVKSWLENGDIIYKEDITEGLDNGPEAILGMFEGKAFGKAIIKVADL